MTSKGRHPSSKAVVFNEHDHTYRMDGKKLMSVTSFISNFFPEFNRDRVSESYAARHGFNQADVLDKWEREGEEARDLGQKVHRYAECLFTEQSLPVATDEQEQGAFNAVNLAAVKLLKRFDFIEVEKIVFSPVDGIAGTIDLLMRNRSKRDIVIFDWKTGKEIKKENTWQNALSPIEHLDDCNWNRHRLQLSFYKRILCKEDYFPPETSYRLALIHLKENGGIGWHRVNDLADEVEAMLRHRPVTPVEVFD